jgi:hypothetical protein
LIPAQQLALKHYLLELRLNAQQALLRDKSVTTQQHWRLRFIRVVHGLLLPLSLHLQLITLLLLVAVAEV